MSVTVRIGKIFWLMSLRKKVIKHLNWNKTMAGMISWCFLADSCNLQARCESWERWLVMGGSGGPSKKGSWEQTSEAQKWEQQAENGRNRPDQKWETAKPGGKHQTRPFSCVKIAVIKWWCKRIVHFQDLKFCWAHASVGIIFKWWLSESFQDNKMK